MGAGLGHVARDGSEAGLRVRDGNETTVFCVKDGSLARFFSRRIIVLAKV